MRRAPKFHNRKVTIDGETFDSAGEAKWFQNLKLMQRAGAIHNLRRQVSMPLHGADGSVVATLILDAVWCDGPSWKTIAEDSLARGERTCSATITHVYADFKGMETPISRLKRKLFAAEYGAQIRLFNERGEIPLTKTGRRSVKRRPREKVRIAA